MTGDTSTTKQVLGSTAAGSTAGGLYTLTHSKVFLGLLILALIFAGIVIIVRIMKIRATRIPK